MEPFTHIVIVGIRPVLDDGMNAVESTNTITLNHRSSQAINTAASAEAPVSRHSIEVPLTALEPSGTINGGSSGEPPAKTSNRRRHILIGIAVLAIAAATATYYAEFVAPYETTDDAFIEAHVAPIASQVPGRVARLLVTDNQEVKQGDVLLEIDPSDYQASLDQANADLAATRSRRQQANAQYSVDQAKVGQEKASVTAAEAEATRAEADLKRYRAVGDQAVSQSQIDLAASQARASAAQVDVASNRQLAAEAQANLDKAYIETVAAEVQRSEAAVRQAELNLSYTRVTAPVSGRVTHRSVEAGAYVQLGQDLLAIVQHDVWIVANFKEKQLYDMKPGQPVEVKVDAYPNVPFKGHVDSIQFGSGARFSLLPPENASGNFVKVVQRVPVKIALDDASDTRYVLGPGMSAVPKIRVK
jgi:membrane fusion protein (multidrug efflux system)